MEPRLYTTACTTVQAVITLANINRHTKFDVPSSPSLNYDVQTDRHPLNGFFHTDGRAIAYSEREHEFTFAKNNMNTVRHFSVLS